MINNGEETQKKDRANLSCHLEINPIIIFDRWCISEDDTGDRLDERFLHPQVTNKR
jgi:hypothetical protein